MNLLNKSSLVLMTALFLLTSCGENSISSVSVEESTSASDSSDSVSDGEPFTITFYQAEVTFNIYNLVGYIAGEYIGMSDTILYKFDAEFEPNSIFDNGYYWRLIAEEKLYQVSIVSEYYSVHGFFYKKFDESKNMDLYYHFTDNVVMTEDLVVYYYVY